MLCYNEKCQGKLKCLATRNIELGHAVRRRYECPDCGERFSTLEKRVIEKQKPVVIEKQKPVVKEKKTKELPSHEEIRWRLTHPGMQWLGAKEIQKRIGSKGGNK